MKTKRYKLQLWGILSLFFPVALFAQGGYVKGTVSDMFTNNGIPYANVGLLRPDSSVVSSAVSQGIYKSYYTKTYYSAPFQLDAPKAGKYIVKCSFIGYETVYKNIDVKFTDRNRYFDIGGLFLQEKTKTLKEATVKATQIKMFFKGDTIVYNADAFQLADGSMLSDLVKQLSGVELRDGRIYAHGKFVENLLLGGKDFFNGDPQMALKNLPAFVVAKIKLYNKAGELSKTTGTDMNDKSYVMDVQLKREYEGTWMGSADVAIGTSSRYSAVLFGMRVDERQAFTIMADINNLSIERDVHQGGTASARGYAGLVAAKRITTNYSFEPNDKLRFSSNAAYLYQSNDNIVGKNTETYLTEGNIFTRSLSRQKSGTTDANAKVSLALRPHKGQYLEFGYNVGYKYNRLSAFDRLANYLENPKNYVTGNLLDSTFAATPGSLLSRIIASRLKQQSKENGYNFNNSLSAKGNFTFAPDLLNVSAQLDYGKRHEERFDHYLLEYPNEDGRQTDFRNRYYDRPGNNYKYKLNAEYYYKYCQNDSINGHLLPYYSFSQTYSSAQNPLYRLDALPGWGVNTDYPLGALPSTTDSLQLSIDAPNSYYSTLRGMNHEVGMKWFHDFRLPNRSWLELQATARLSIDLNSMDYNRNARSYEVHRNSYLFNPAFSLKWRPAPNDRDGEKTEWQFSYDTNGSQPSMNYLIDIRDDSDPLNISLGNANLKNTRNHELSLGFSKQWEKRTSSLNSYISYNILRNAVVMNSVYDKATGVRTYQPQNVNGNQNANWTASYLTPLDKDQKWMMSTMTIINYNHSVDMNTISAGVDAQNSTVDNFSINQYIQMQFRFNSKWQFFTNVHGLWYNVNGTRPDFATLNTADLKYNFKIQTTLPWDITLSTDITLQTRYGYDDSSFNENHWIWNARLSKNIIKNKLSLAVETMDILKDNSNLWGGMNSQGRTEIYRNVLPSYTMFHLIYRFNKTPKKK